MRIAHLMQVAGRMCDIGDRHDTRSSLACFKSNSTVALSLPSCDDVACALMIPESKGPVASRMERVGDLPLYVYHVHFLECREERSRCRLPADGITNCNGPEYIQSSRHHCNRLISPLSTAAARAP